MVIDTHIHVGQYNDLYFAPLTIHELVEQMDIAYYAVSSTTQCEENYTKVLSEIKELMRLDGKKVLPIMWITPEALQGNIAWYLESDVKWRMLKIHPFFNKTVWNPHGECLSEVLDIARELHLPLLIHTGNEECCEASLFEPVIKNNADITFVLAHGRPIGSALRLAWQYENVYVDSAFMPIEDMKFFVDKGLSMKLLWGTDMCIPKYYQRNINMADYYSKKLRLLREVCSQEQYDQITLMNAKVLFYLQ